MSNDTPRTRGGELVGPRDPFAQWRAPRRSWASPSREPGAFPDYGYNKLGTGELLHIALTRAFEQVQAAGWNVETLAPVRSKRFGPEAHRLNLDPGTKAAGPWIIPLAAKGYMISRDGASWWSVSESIINAAKEYGSNLVFAYIAAWGEIMVTSTQNAKDDDGYLRLGERYRGWGYKNSVPLEAWLRAPESFTIQTRLG